MNKKRIINAACFVVPFVGILTLGACSTKALEGYQDAPIGQRVNKNVTIIEMPDGYANIATVCKDGIRYSSATVGDATAVRAISTVADPACAGK